jgi:hypothetical protein
LHRAVLAILQFLHSLPFVAHSVAPEKPLRPRPET